jgi:hypothetical protein
LVGGDMAQKNKRGVRELKWMTISRPKPNLVVKHSKFLDPRFQITFAQFVEIWPAMTEEEQVDFAQAYCAKARVTGEDEKILNVLLQPNQRRLWNSLVPLITRHPDKVVARAFVRRLLRDLTPESSLNDAYFAVELLDDKESVPELEKKYKEYKLTFGINPQKGERLMTMNYLGCCRALWKVTGQAEYRKEIEMFLTAYDDLVARRAKDLLKGS